jgi:formylglycine-generating enzyme required for sulfatase activity
MKTMNNTTTTGCASDSESQMANGGKSPFRPQHSFLRYSLSAIRNCAAGAALALFGLGIPGVQANPLLTIDTVYVGDAGNTAANSINASSWGSNYGYGAVNYDYRIGTNLVTNQQYSTFLNAVAASDPYGLYHTPMEYSSFGGITRAGGWGSYTYSVKTNFNLKPVNYVSFYNSAMFTNWLSNGATSMSSITSGAYTISVGEVTLVSRNSNVATLTSVGHTLSVGDQVTVSWTSGYNGTFIVTAVAGSTFSFAQTGLDQGVTAASGSLIGANVTRDAGASWWLPSEDEWVKAAYYDPTTGNYSRYATKSNTAPTIATSNTSGNITNPGTNVANYASGVVWNSATGNVSTVGSAGATSFYGTYDQAGNVWEWNEALVSDSTRGQRGGSSINFEDALRASLSENRSPTFESSTAGFRVATVPEPSSALLVLMAGAAWLLKKRRRE